MHPNFLECHYVVFGLEQLLLLLKLLPKGWGNIWPSVPGHRVAGSSQNKLTIPGPPDPTCPLCHRGGSSSRATTCGHLSTIEKMCKWQLQTGYQSSHPTSQCHQRMFLNETHHSVQLRLLLTGLCSRWWGLQGDSWLDGQVEVTGHSYPNKFFFTKN